MRKSQKRKKFLNLIYVCAIILVIFLANYLGIDLENNTEQVSSQITESEAESINIDKEKLNILYLNVGQADSELILYKDKVMLIDTGNTNDGEEIIKFLKEKNINKIDYLVGTHIHEDHIGSMQYVVKEMDISEIYLPYNETSTNSYYVNLLKNISEKEMQINEVEVGDKINFDDIECEIMAVDNNSPEDQNDASIVINLKYNNNNFLFTGDATKKVEKTRKWQDVDVLKVGHHGSDTSSSQEFIDEVKPEVSIISVGKDNSYNLPKEEVIERLEKSNSKVYRTDIDGTIQIISDGNNYEIFKINRSFDGD